MVIFHVFADEALSIALIRGSIIWLIRDIFLRTDSVFLRAKTDKSKNEKKVTFLVFPFQSNWIKIITKEKHHLWD